MSVELTRDSDALICLLYKNYCESRSQGKSKSEANYFDDSNSIQETIIPKWDPENVADTCWELHRAGLLICQLGNDLANDVMLSDAGIIYMENRFKGKIKSILNYLINVLGFVI